MKVWSQRFATSMGLVSILIWASLVAGVKLISEALSPIQAVAMIYSVSAISILFITGWPKIWHMPRRYIWGAGSLFVAYEILFLVAISLTDQREQVLLVAMINYLWPPLLIVFSVLARHLKAKLWLILGLLFVLSGFAFVINPDIFVFKKTLAVLAENPWAYGWAFLAALVWPCYCILTKTYAAGHNAVSLFFLMAALGLWVLHFYLAEVFIQPSWPIGLGILLTGSLIGLAYRNWNQSMQYGNLQLLIPSTYFMPVLSSLMSMWILGLTPTWSFWLGTMLVSIGALICWAASQEV